MLGRPRQGRKVSLIPRLPEHVETIYDWWSEYPDFFPLAEPPTFDQFMERYRRRAGDNDWTLWSIVTTESLSSSDADYEDVDVIGMTELSDFNADRCCLNSFLYIVPPQRAMGLGAEAIQLRSDYAFEMLDVELLETTTETTNLGAQHILERAGYRRTGERPHAFRENGKWKNLYFYALLREWWEVARIT